MRLPSFLHAGEPMSYKSVIWRGLSFFVKDGFLFLTERIKDLFKTSNGKYIAPQAIETKMVVDRYIDQISIIADERKFVAALIVPDYKLVEKFAADKGIHITGYPPLSDFPSMTSSLERTVPSSSHQLTGISKHCQTAVLIIFSILQNGGTSTTAGVLNNTKCLENSQHLFLSLQVMIPTDYILNVIRISVISCSEFIFLPYFRKVS